MAQQREQTYGDDAQEAIGQLLDLWCGVNGFDSAELHRYPVGTLAIWMRFSDRVVADSAPEEWMGVQIVKFIRRAGPVEMALDETGGIVW
jgi:hypothetical protein